MKLFSKQYWFFKGKINGVQKAIWDIEFKISKSRQVREGVRQDRDRAVEALNQIEARLKGVPSDADEQAKIVMADNIKRYEKQMKMVDDQINGKEGNDKEESIIGLLEQIKSYVELKQMYQDYANAL